MRKGLALEMIIMLIMLLVVAGVIITVFIQQFDPNRLGGIGAGALEKNQFESKCQELCDQIANTETAASFCEEYAAVDWNGDKTIDQAEISKVRNLRILDACENRIYCFQVHECRKIRLQGNERNQADACRRFSCQSFASQLPPAQADDIVSGPDGKIQAGESDPGSSCRLSSPSWYDQYISNTPCSNPPT